MSDRHFSVTVAVRRSPDEAFAAINDPRAWWGADIAGRTDRPGDEWTYRYKELHRSTQKVVELVPGRKVAWRVVDADMSFLKDRAEWKGTTIVFDLAPTEEGTEIRFSHLGLAPEVECFDVCSDAWTGLIRGSLKSFIESGRGDPDSVEKKPAS